MYRPFQKERSSRLSHIASVFLNICICVCEIFYGCSVWYVVCNCLCLTIHHRVVFPSHSLYSLQSQTCSLLCKEKRQKTFFHNDSDKCSPTPTPTLNESIHSKLSRKRLRGGTGWGGRNIISAKQENNQGR